MRESKRIELQARLEFWRSSLTALRAAYLALLDSGVQKYKIEDRELTRLDLPRLLSQILEAEKKIDELEALLAGYKSRKAFGIIPRDW
jgi:hypothetical protein